MAEVITNEEPVTKLKFGEEWKLRVARGIRTEVDSLERAVTVCPGDAGAEVILLRNQVTELEHEIDKWVLIAKDRGKTIQSQEDARRRNEKTLFDKIERLEDEIEDLNGDLLDAQEREDAWEDELAEAHDREKALKGEIRRLKGKIREQLDRGEREERTKAAKGSSKSRARTRWLDAEPLYRGNLGWPHDWPSDVRFEPSGREIPLSLPKQLSDVPAGAIFLDQKGVLATKSEYMRLDAQDRLIKPWQAECIILGTGEYAHFEMGNSTLVQEVLF